MHSKQLTIILLTLTTFRAFGQDKNMETQHGDFKRVQLGISISPDMCFRTLENNDGGATIDAIVKLRNENETVKLGYTAGLNVCVTLNKFLSIESGIHYSNKGYQTKMMTLTPSQPTATLPNKAKTIDNFHCIDIPVKANFTLGKKKVRFITSAGVTTNFFIKETSTTVLYYSDRTERERNPSTVDFNNVNISPTLSVGIDYKINSRMNLRIEPTIRYGILKIIDTPVTGYLYSGGLNMSYYVRL